MNYLKFAVVVLAAVIALAYFKLILDTLSPCQLVQLCRFMSGTAVAILCILTCMIFKKGWNYMISGIKFGAYIMAAIVTLALVFGWVDRDQARQEYAVWQKLTGNPKELTFKEFYTVRSLLKEIK